MSVGGKVVDVVIVNARKWWVNTNDRKPPHKPNLCAVYVDPEGFVIAPGDSLWWQAGTCYWTPIDRPDGVFDIPLRKIGNSGVNRPTQETP